MNNLFESPLANSAMKALTPEQKESYKIMGEHMFSVCKFDQDEKNINPEQEITELLNYTIQGLKSGLHPNDLDKRELQAMYDIYGEDWYVSYGYQKDEVPPNPSPKTSDNNTATKPTKKRRNKGKRRLFTKNKF